jgi:hypothetical protein
MMMTDQPHSHEQVLERLNARLKENETWPVKGVFVDVYVKTDSGEEKEIVDISLHIGCSSNDDSNRQEHRNNFHSRQKMKPTDLQKYYFSPEYNSNAAKGRAAIAKYVCALFDTCGGGIVASGTSSMTGAEIVLRCERHRLAKMRTKQENQKGKDTKSIVTSTSRPRTDDKKCKFHLTIYFEPSRVNPLIGRWFFYKEGIGCQFQNGHVKKKAHEITRRVALLDEEELKITDNGMDINLSSQSMAMMFKQRTNLVIRPKKLHDHHVKSQKNTKGLVTEMTPAEQIIHQLTTNPSISVVYLVANVSVGYDLVTTYTGKMNKKKKLNISFESNVSSNGAEPTTSPMTVANIMAMTRDIQGTKGDTPATTAKDIYDSLKINEDTQILLSIAWMTDKQRRFLAMFPESASADVIFKTNNEKRPSFHVCAKTSSNETFGGFFAFLASQAIWSFDFVWSAMLPAIADPRFEKRNEQMTTDDDEKLHGPFTLQTTERFQKSKRRNCAFHLFVQGSTKNNITISRVKDGQDKYIGKALLKKWMLSWTDSVESEEEIQVSYNCLMAMLEEDEFATFFDLTFPDDVVTFLISKVWRHRDSFAHYKFMDHRTFGTRTSNQVKLKEVY